MLKLTGVVVVLCVFAAVAFAGSEKPIGDLKALAGDWRSVGNANLASIHINADGTYQGTAASGAQTIGRITITAGKAYYRSTSSEGTVTLSEERGKNVLTFAMSSGRTSATLERVR